MIKAIINIPATDMLQWMVDHLKSFDMTLDGGSTYIYSYNGIVIAKYDFLNNVVSWQNSQECKEAIKVCLTLYKHTHLLSKLK